VHGIQCSVMSKRRAEKEKGVERVGWGECELQWHVKSMKAGSESRLQYCSWGARNSERVSPSFDRGVLERFVGKGAGLGTWEPVGGGTFFVGSGAYVSFLGLTIIGGWCAQGEGLGTPYLTFLGTEVVGTFPCICVLVFRHSYLTQFRCLFACTRIL
jgi:hypothetical protein